MIASRPSFRIHLRHAAFALFLLPFPAARAQLSSPEDLRYRLETTWNAWRSSMLQKDFAAWQQTTSAFRQMVTRNMIVSQKLPFPDSIFTIPVDPPDARTLRFLKVDSKGALSQIIYAGDLELAPPDSKIKDSLVVIRLLLEPTGWKVDSTRFVAIHTNPALAEQWARGDLAFLRGPDFALPDQLPPTPPACREPDHVAAVELIAPGSTARVTFLNIPYPVVSGTESRDLLMGGLANGRNEITLEILSVEDETAAKEGVRLSLLRLSPQTGARSERIWTTLVPAKPGKSTFTIEVSPAGTAVQR